MRPVERLLHLAAGAALVIGAGLLVHQGDRYAVVADLSHDARNTLDPRSREVLALLPGALTVVAFVPESPAVRRGIGDFFARYRRYKPDLGVRFVDPRADAETADAYGARLGELVVEYGGRRERIGTLNESATTNALARLARGAERYVTVLANNGERRVARNANHDLSIFAEHLARRGLALREYVLGQTQEIPANTAVLVLASPTVAYAPGEIDQINRHVAAGGNLLWLTEPDAPAALAVLERALGFERFPGTIVDPIGLTKFRNPAYAVVLKGAAHAITAGFDQTVAMPYAAALVPAPNHGWRAAIVARTEPEAWTETGPFSGNVGFDAPDEVQGALSVALALTRRRADGGMQRVVVVGDGDFLSNSVVGNLGNRELGRRIVEWLSADDALIDIEVPDVADGVLDLALWQRLTIFLFFGVGLPLAFALNAGVRWWRRRHA